MAGSSAFLGTHAATCAGTLLISKPDFHADSNSPT
jgi:hypothetical protein